MILYTDCSQLFYNQPVSYVDNIQVADDAGMYVLFSIFFFFFFFFFLWGV